MKALLKKTIPHEVSIPLTGEDIADLFWELDADSQARFFNRLCLKEFLSTQLQAVSNSDELKIGGRNVMSRIGEYA